MANSVLSVADAAAGWAASRCNAFGVKGIEGAGDPGYALRQAQGEPWAEGCNRFAEAMREWILLPLLALRASIHFLRGGEQTLCILVRDCAEVGRGEVRFLEF